MAKGQKSKAGHILQMIWHGANPNLFNANGKRVVCHNAEDYDYNDGIEFDKLKRKGAKALIANVPLEEMWTGNIKGPLHYNLMDDQILPFWIAKGVETPITVDGVNCIDTLYVRPQLDRADREFFSIEEGRAGSGSDLGCYGMFTSFKWSSKRGNKGTSRFEVNFTTQAAVRRAQMTGGVAQNHKTRIIAANVSAPVVLNIVAPGLAAKNVSLAIGNSIAQNIAAFAAQGFTVASTGTVAVASGEVHRLIALNATGNALIYDTITVTPGMTAAALETAIKAKGGTFANRTVTGSTNAVSFPDLLDTALASVTGDVANASNASDNNAATQTGNFSSGNSVSFNLSSAKKVAKIRVKGAGTFAFSRIAGGNVSGVAPNTTIADDGTWYEISLSDTGTAGNTFYLLSPSGGGYLKEVELIEVGAVVNPSNGTYVITTPAATGDVPDITDTPGAGWNTTNTQPGAAGGTLDFEFTNPANALMVVNKTSGDNYAISTVQQGSDGSILQAMKPDDPIMPGHLYLYSSDTPAGLEDEANLVGQIGEWDIDDSKICQPVSHHVRVTDPERPTLPTTYNAHAEEEAEDDGIKLSVTMDAGEDGTMIDSMKALMRASGSRIVSVPRYWRIAAIHPGSAQRVFVDFYGSVGAAVPVKWAGSIEQYTFVYDLLENKTASWNFRVKTRRLA